MPAHSTTAFVLLATALHLGAAELPRSRTSRPRPWRPSLIASRNDDLEQRKAELRKQFEEFDKDQSGFLDETEFEAARQQLGNAAFEDYDTDKNKRVSIEEFLPVSIPSTVLQIVNNVAGAGILTLSAGMAGGVGSVPAALLCLALGGISGITFHMIGAACELTGQTSFKGLWAATLGSSTTWVVDTAVALMCLAAAIIYSGILGDISTQLLGLAGVSPSFNIRWINILAITLSALTPLSLLRDLSALAFTSVLGCIAVAYTAVFITLRCVDGSYGLPAGRHIAALPAALVPAFEKASRWKVNFRALVLTSNLGLAYIAHYNAPAFYRALDRRSTKRFGVVCVAAFSVLSLLYLGIMLAGYFTFGDVTAANILKNYAENDVLAILGRLATFASILFGFPLAMLGLKDSTTSLIESATASAPAHGASANRRSSLGTQLDDALRALATSHQHLLVLALLAAISAIAITVTDIGLVVGVAGALLGSAIVYIFPALIYSAASNQAASRSGNGRSPISSSLVYALLPLGSFLGVLGVYMTLSGA